MKLLHLVCLLALTLAMASTAAAQVRMVRVDPATQEVTLRNFGVDAVDVGSWWICVSPGTYRQLNALTPSGPTQLSNGDEVTIVYAGFIGTDGQGLGLYEFPSFDLPGPGQDPSIRDYMQYRTPDGFRENVAVAAGIWPEDDFIDAEGPYSYIGNGDQNGGAFWTSGTVSAVPSLALPGATLLVGCVIAVARRARRNR